MAARRCPHAPSVPRVGLMRSAWARLVRHRRLQDHAALGSQDLPVNAGGLKFVLVEARVEADPSVTNVGRRYVEADGDAAVAAWDVDGREPGCVDRVVYDRGACGDDDRVLIFGAVV